jgi:hypothetical protein
MSDLFPDDENVSWDDYGTSRRQISWTESIIMWASFALVIWATAANTGISDVYSCIMGFLGGFALCLWSRIGIPTKTEEN